MKIAIVGGGLAGLALAYFLKESEVTVFDAGGGASRVAAGLLHKRHKDKVSMYADEAYNESKTLLDVAGSPYEENLEGGVTVWMDLYLEGLRKASGAQIAGEKLERLPEGYDCIVLACGNGIAHFYPDLPVCYVKGQLLECAPVCEQSMISRGYVAAGREATYVGSTYEREYKSELPDQQVAIALLREKVADMIDIDSLDIRGCHAGVRVRRKGHYLPIVKKVREGEWIFTALGSRGLLYHAFYAKKLAFAITMGENCLP